MTAGVESLPSRFPIFPLPGALLLPNGNLPLNIFEPRYLRMIRDAMQSERVVGMIQPTGEPSKDGNPPLYQTGCVGRIDNFKETDDGRYLITLTGICRFDIAEELTTTTPYRQILASFERWVSDFTPEPPPDTMRGDLLAELEVFFDQQGIEVDWPALETAPLAGLVTSLAMICPFEATEKQALLEAPDLAKQAEMLKLLLTMANLGDGASTQTLN